MAETWVAVSTAGTHGKTWRWVAKDGSRWSRKSQLVRGFKTEIDQRITFSNQAGKRSVREIRVRGTIPEGDAAEYYRVKKGRYAFKSPVDRGVGVARDDLFYTVCDGTLDATILLADALRQSPNGAIDVLPSGRLTLDKLASAQVSNGLQTRTLTAYTINGYGFAPQPVWYNGDSFFGAVASVSYVPEGWEGAVPALSKAQDEALAARGPALLERIAPKMPNAVAFENVRLFDADARRFREGMTVVVDADLISAVGAASAVSIPAGATIFDGRGKTLVPGLWDSHQHYRDDARGPIFLSVGITSTRNPGSEPVSLLARKARIDGGRLLGPRIIPSLMIDGAGPLASQLAITANNESDAIAAVRRAHADGFFGVKLYGSLAPSLVKPIADEAHRLGLRVSGHIPAGMRPLEAVRAGYDEISHIYFAMMQAMPDSVVQHSNGLERFFGPREFSASVELNSAEVVAYVDELARRGTTIDPTLAVTEALLLDETGKLSRSYVPYEGILPPQIDRDFRAGAIRSPRKIARATKLRSFANLQALSFALHKRGVTLVAGTDGTGIELIHELELYVAAGMTPSEALASATIVPAKIFKMDDRSGSITAGKLAELVLVDGDPSVSIGDLRRVELVVRDGRIMRGEDLRRAAGIAGMPRSAR
jgi:hypothetical protein